MILGNESKGTIIVAQNMLGYDSFIDSDFTKPFKENEPLEILYPPDHPNSGSNYVFDTPMGVDTLGTFSFEWGRGTHYFPEVSKLTVNTDYAFPYQSEIEIVFTPTANSGMRPLTDRAVTADNGVDAFLLKGSVIRGKFSGAKRFYAGPFKGFTKEIEGVCQGATSVNLMDGSDCAGYLKGSFYENGYNPAVYNLFNYSDQSQTIIDVKNPFNPYFMVGTEYEGLDYTWINARNRFKRPIPYSMLGTTSKGVAAILIDSKHVITTSTLDVESTQLRFYSKTQGFITPSVQSSVSTFKQMWDAIGFVDENRDSQTLTGFNKLKAYFDGLKVITFAQPLPSDVVPVYLYDPNTDGSVSRCIVIGQEGRGHMGMFCPSISSTVQDTHFAQLNLTDTNCGKLQNPHSCFVNGDEGSPTFFVDGEKCVLVGLVSGGGNGYVTLVGVGIGSSEKYSFPWGYAFSPKDILALYTASN